jgi:malate/lactate dehydrogenase
MGTSAMSLRLRAGIAARLRLAVEHVQAWIAGSRRSPVPLWSSATAAGIPLSDWRVMGHGRLTVRDRAELLQMAIGDADDADEALLAVCAAIVGAENRVLSVASSLANVDADLDGAWLSWPTIVNDGGAEALLPLKLNDAERAALRAQAAAMS